jgi:putative heme degradation protein
MALFDVLPEWNSPLTPGVQLVNLSHSEDQMILRAELGADWARMFAQLHCAGDGLVMTRNEAAILGRRMAYPALNVTSGGGKAACGEGGLWLDFHHLGAARAVHIRRETGHVFGVEFSDEVGHTVHRFTLTPESDMDEFIAWVRLHQACAAHTPDKWRDDGNDAPVAPRTVRQSDAGALVSIVAACVERVLPVRVTVRCPAVTQRAEFTPRSFQPCGEWWFASDDAHGFHFQPGRFASVRVEERPCEGRGARAVLGALAEGGTGALLIEAGFGAEGPWRALIEMLA